MLFYCLKCRKNIERNPKGCKYKTVMFAVAKNRELLKSKKLGGY